MPGGDLMPHAEPGPSDPADGPAAQAAGAAGDGPVGVPPIRLLIVDDSTMVRQMLAALVRGQADIEVVGMAANGREAITAARRLKPDVCLLDLEMPVMGGRDALPRLRAVADTEVVIVSSLAQPGSEERGACLSLGAVAIVAKPSGAVSPDLAAARGAEILGAVRLAAGLNRGPAAPAAAAAP